MKTRPDEPETISEPDAALLRRVADACEPPAMTPVRRARFDADLDTRLARERWRFAPWVAAAVTAGAAALGVLAYTPRTPTTSEIVDANASDDAYVQAVTGDSSSDFDAALPAEYQAIAMMIDPE